MSKSLLVIITAENCGACKNLEQSGELNRIISTVQQSGLVEVKHLPVPKMGEMPLNVPSDLSRLVGWYPIFILISRSSWNSGRKLSADIFNSNMVEGRFVPQPTRNTSSSSIMSWINEQLSMNPIFNSEPSAIIIQDKSKHSKYNEGKSCPNVRYFLKK